MSIASIFALLGGLALFLYGMQMMSSNLEAIAGERLKEWLQKLTANRFVGVIVGAVITAIIQSSSATTVMVVGFVNSGLMNLNQAVWIIMGANIGTTITGQLVALDIDLIAPLIAFLGVFLIMFSKNNKVQHFGNIIAGLGVLFIGMGMMSDAMVPLRDNEAFVSLLTSFSNPFLGILFGAVFTAIIQSSSASVGILQALATSGVVDLHSAVYVLFGQNIGTCITALIASIGTNRNAKRTTLIHFMFNFIGTIIFVLICMNTSFVDFMMAAMANPAAQIANVHTIFNITTTILLLPAGNYLAKLAVMILPDKEEKLDEDRWFDDIMTSNHVLGVSSMAINSLRNDMIEMYKIASQNMLASFKMIEKYDESKMTEIRNRENQIDQYNFMISKRIASVMSMEHSPSDAERLNRIFMIIGNIERIGDHAMNIAGYGELMNRKKINPSAKTLNQVNKMREITKVALEAVDLSQPGGIESLTLASQMEQKIDDTTAQYRKEQLKLLNNKEENMECALLISELLVDYERIGDHLLNIAQAIQA